MRIKFQKLISTDSHYKYYYPVVNGLVRASFLIVEDIDNAGNITNIELRGNSAMMRCLLDQTYGYADGYIACSSERDCKQKIKHIMEKYKINM